jgi:hypothetical protein
MLANCQCIRELISVTLTPAHPRRQSFPDRLAFLGIEVERELPKRALGLGAFDIQFMDAPVFSRLCHRKAHPRDPCSHIASRRALTGLLWMQSRQDQDVNWV